MAYPYRRNYSGHEQGSSPWMLLMILGVILIIGTISFQIGLDVDAMAYQLGLRSKAIK